MYKKIKHGLFIVAMLLYYPLHASGIVTLTFDDGYQSAYDTVKPILQKYHVLATFYVTTSLLGTPGYLTPEQVIELHQLGHEIGSHCVTHRNLKHISLKEVEKELKESKEILEAMIHTPVTQFAAPFGAINEQIVNVIRKYYQTNRTIMNGYNDKIKFNPYKLKTKVVYNQTTLKEIESWLKETSINDFWLILVYHQIGGGNEALTTHPSILEQQIKLIQEYNIIKKIKQDRQDRFAAG